MLLLVDNNDSFTYNIVEAIRSVSNVPIVVKNSADIQIEEVEQYQMIIFSPGPSLPDDYPIMKQILNQYCATIPILGICLGHQAICSYFGAQLVQSDSIIHGFDSLIQTNSQSLLFKGVSEMIVGRYHSWHAIQIPESLSITAQDKYGIVMAVEHKHYPVYSVQFHPESYITKQGKQIFKNFIDAATS
ncbi:MAG: Anthranilate synthase, amidotransferase component [Bacteroidetes bacterium]|nr:Anthranilate synthase, amidotransferase component [Bacteroidota bacterium]